MKTNRTMAKLSFAVAACVLLQSGVAEATCIGQYFITTNTQDIGGGCTFYYYDSYQCNNGMLLATGAIASVCSGLGSPPPSDTCVEDTTGDKCLCNPAYPMTPMCDPDPAKTAPTKCATAGDPFSTANGASQISKSDVDIPGALGGLQFKRHYSSKAEDWLDGLPFSLVPPPFGASQLYSNAPLWTHNFTSLVTIQPYIPNFTGESWQVRDRGGHVYRFLPCTTAPCWATPTGGNRSIPERLQKTTSGFEFYERDGTRLVFNNAYFRAGETVSLRWFLTQVKAATGAIALTLSYVAPKDAAESTSLGCPLGVGTSGGVPYLFEVASPEARLRLKYVKRNRPGTSVAECILSYGVLVSNAPTPTVSAHVFDYVYSTTTAGLLEQASIGSPAIRTETFSYSPTSYVESQDGKQLNSHTYTSGYVSADTWVGGAMSSVSYGVGNCGAASNYCCGESPSVSTITNSGARSGDGTTAAAGLTTTYYTVSNYRQALSPRHYQVTDACGGTNKCSEGTIQTEWSCSTATAKGSELGTKDKRGNWTTSTSVNVTSVTPSQLEVRSASLGAIDMNGTDALEKENRTYVYGANNQQLLETIKTPSVLVPASDATTKSFYDANNRLNRIARQGKTMDLAGNITDRFVGVFLKNSSSVCTTQAADTVYNRTLEIDGPCELTAMTDASCPSVVGGVAVVFPVTVFEYWPSTEITYNKDRLKKVTRANNAACTIPLVTQFSNYDARGNAQTMIDENSITTTLTFDDESRVLSRSVGSPAKLTSYSYLSGSLSAIRYPEGNGEVFCHRSGATNADCTTGGTWTPELQWTAKKACGSTPASCIGAWSERINFTYDATDGTLMQADYRTCTGAVCSTGTDGKSRRVEKFSSDAHKRLTWSKTGDTAAGIVRKYGFDGASNLTAVGHAWNSPEDFCRTGGTYSSLCSRLEYDRADRPAIFDESPTSTTSRRTCFDYDSQGNVSKVSSGCLATDACSNLNTSRPNSGGTATTCDTSSNEYVYDDFGNVLQATLGNTEVTPGNKGTVRAQYDSRGNVTKRQTEDQKFNYRHTSYTYDALDRVTKAERVFLATATELYSMQYDTPSTLPTSCTQQPARTKGRLAQASDPLGTTWYQYNDEGRVTAEIRLRPGVTSCTGTNLNDWPTTTYAYSNNGYLTAITYPHGRQVTYTYGAGNLKHRVTTVSAKTYNGGWVGPTSVVENVAWEPYGGVRSYQMKFPVTANVATLEYQQGASANLLSTAALQCPSASRVASGGTEETSDDHTGRMRAVWVSTGAQSVGGGAGDIYQRTYAWSADQVAQTYSCYLNLSPRRPQVEDYTPGTGLVGYDRALQLRSVVAPNFATNGGSFAQRKYDYDARGNRSSVTIDSAGTSHGYTYGTSNLKDRLSQYSASPGGVQMGFLFDLDGRIASKRWPADSVNRPQSKVVLGYSDSIYGKTGPGADSAYQYVSVNGGTHLFWYDFENRRRRKDFPLGVTDEFFYDTAHSMLEDRGHYSASTNAPYPIDEYIYLGGRAIAMFRGSFNSSWVRQNDNTGTCARNSEAVNCGLHFFVTDVIGKPLVAMDSSRRITGVGEYEPFGHINRVDVTGMPGSESAHPYSGSAASTTLDMPQFAQGMQLAFRAHFAMMDTEETCSGTVRDAIRLSNANASSVPYETFGGSHKGERVSQWWPTPADASGIASLRLEFLPQEFNFGPSVVTGACENNAWPYNGYVMDHYEYRRYQTGATPFFPPFRFPGQYHDTDTDFFENWNRYYDPQTGRYLQPEPLLQTPAHAVAMAKAGYSTPAFAYALNNPIRVVDPTGLAPSFDSPSAARGELARAVLAGNWNRAAEIATFLGGATPVVVTRMQQAYDAANRTAGPCFSVAKNIYDGFKAAGVEAEIRFIRTGADSGPGARIGRLVGEKWEIVSTQGIHAVVESGGKYFDAFTGPAGQKASQYMTQMSAGMPTTLPLVVH